MIYLQNSDCLKWLKNRNDNSIDIIITSPPYNLKNKGGDIVIDSYKDNMKDNDYFNWQVKILKECKRVLKPTGAIFYNHKNKYVNGQCVSPLPMIIKSGLKINQEIIWNRKSSVDNNRTRFSTKTKKIYWLFKDKTFKLKQNWVSMGDVWDINRPNPKCNYGHKATFPVQLIDRIIRSLDIDNEVLVVDIFAGTGTVGQVCCKNNLNCMLIEKELKWCLVMEKKVYEDYLQEEEPIIKKSYREGVK